ncbi:unnamed protein product [marine sediment metagenome]|uniref:F-box domain-containing protein n=1 Tax=marine sediment metagenome TaxID=412755 RepID=X1TQ57_9ZZZZ
MTTIPQEVFYNILLYLETEDIYNSIDNVCMNFRIYVEYYSKKQEKKSILNITPTSMVRNKTFKTIMSITFFTIFIFIFIMGTDTTHIILTIITFYKPTINI